MKKKLSILLMSSVIAVSFAGCQTDTSDNNASSSVPESSVSASSEDTSAEESENSENSDTSADESSDENIMPEYLSALTSYTILSSDKLNSKSPDLSEPAVFTVTNSDELDKFYDEYKDTYFLDDVESKFTFTETIETVFGESYLDENDIIIMVQKYDSDYGIEVNEVYVEGSELKIQVYKNTPASADKTAYSCCFMGISKADRADAEPVIVEVPAINTGSDSESSTTSSAQSSI